MSHFRSNRRRAAVAVRAIRSFGESLASICNNPLASAVSICSIASTDRPHRANHLGFALVENLFHAPTQLKYRLGFQILTERPLRRFAYSSKARAAFCRAVRS
jgi:hypothetical protein